MVLVPWQSVWAARFPGLGVDTNSRAYPGVGHHDRWFHCSSGTLNIPVRQQSVAFTHPYTDPSAEVVGFVMAAAKVPAFPQTAQGRRIGLVDATGPTMHFTSQIGRTFTPAAGDVRAYGTHAEAWTALLQGTVDAVFMDGKTATRWLQDNTAYGLVPAEGNWTAGVAYGCHPEYGHLLSALNTGLVRFKASPEYRALCAEYPTINCDHEDRRFNNSKSEAHPEAADHPSEAADLVLGTAADFGEYNYVRNGTLGGFDIELTKAVCARANIKCAIVTVPSKSVWASAYPEFGWDKNPKVYPGRG